MSCRAPRGPAACPRDADLARPAELCPSGFPPRGYYLSLLSTGPSGRESLWAVRTQGRVTCSPSSSSNMNYLRFISKEEVVYSVVYFYQFGLGNTQLITCVIIQCHTSVLQPGPRTLACWAPRPPARLRGRGVSPSSTSCSLALQDASRLVPAPAVPLTPLTGGLGPRVPTAAGPSRPPGPPRAQLEMRAHARGCAHVATHRRPYAVSGRAASARATPCPRLALAANAGF